MFLLDHYFDKAATKLSAWAGKWSCHICKGVDTSSLAAETGLEERKRVRMEYVKAESSSHLKMSSVHLKAF